MIKLTKLEQETIISFNEWEPFAEVYTHNGRLKTRLNELHRKRPEEVQHIRSDEGSESYRIPKRWIKINPPRIFSDEQKETMRVSVEKARNAKISECT